MSKEIAFNSYKGLLVEVRNHVENTQDIIANQKVRMAWLVGRSIDLHLLQNNQSSYGKSLFEKLASDSGITQSVLYKMRSFYKMYPEFPENSNNLNWSHYRILLSVKEGDQRNNFEKMIEENSWNSTKLQSEVKMLKASSFPNNTLQKQKLKPARGRLFSYKLTNLDSEEIFVDCGFNIFEKVEQGVPASLKKELESNKQTVQTLKDGNNYSFKKLEISSNKMHIYKARLERVVDGDTIRVVLDLGFKIFHREILRLAKINAPERKSEEGKKSAAALKRILKNTSFLIIKTTKVDIYGRYIADVFLSDEAGLMTPQQVADEGVYLNQILLDEGLALPFM